MVDEIQFYGSTNRMLPSELKATLSHRTTFKPRAFTTGWALQAASLIDTHCPSLINHVLTASDCKRQVIFATLADLRLTTPDKLAADLRDIAPTDCLTTLDPLAQIGRALIVSKPRQIIEAVFGFVPEGLLGVMKRIGSQPFACPLTYRLLHDLMSRREHRARAKALVQVAGLITEDAIRIIADLDGPWLSPAVICRIRSRQELDAFIDAVELIRWVCPKVSDEELAASFENLSPRASASEWASRWLSRATAFLAIPPVPDDPEFRLLDSGNAMEQVGRDLQNCLRDKIISCALGRQAFVLHTSSSAVIELVRLRDGGNDAWALERLHGSGHAPVSSETVRTMVEKLSAVGILIPARFTEPALVSRVMGFLGFVQHDFWECVEDYARERTTTDEVVA
ncbi:MAG: hypothetical protein ACJ8DV_10875 [Microvirga sp.]